MRRALALAASLALLAARAAPADDRKATAEGAHYRLTATGTQAEADDWLKMLETAWPLYADFFGKSPVIAKGAHLDVLFFETLPDMQDAIRKAGGTPPADAGGYYDPASKTAFAFRQPSVWWTRALILHECAHQFHRLGRVAPNVSPPAWYGEGVVEHLSHHTWDGEHLRLGVVPMLSLEDYPGKALDAVKRGASALDDVLDGKTPAPRPECMHVVRYLRSAEGGKLRAKFDDVASRLDRGAKVDAGGFASAFGSWKKLRPAFLAWLETVQQPWEPLFVDWDPRGEAALRGTAATVGLCRRRAATKHVAARMRPLGTGAWRGGVLLGWTGPDDYVVGVVENGSRAHVDVRRDGAWRIVADAAAPPGTDGTWRVEATREGTSVKFVVEGTTLATVESASPSMGLAVDACSVDFTEIKAE